MEALQIWYDMIYTYKIADPNMASREATVPYQDFLDGNVAMTLMNPWGMGLITDGFGRRRELGDRAAAAGRIRTCRRHPLYAYYWAVNAQTTDEAKETAAIKLVGFLASEPGQWLKNVNFIQPRSVGTTAGSGRVPVRRRLGSARC